MNPVKTNFRVAIALFSITTLVVAACNKQGSGGSSVPFGKQSIAVYLNDDPIPNLSSVLVDIRYVEVKVDTGAIHHDDAYYDDDHEGDSTDTSSASHESDRFGQWDTLQIQPGVYDLLKLKNGVDTLLANGLAYAGKVSRIRITLGTANSVVVDSTTYPLTICSGAPYVYVRVMSNDMDDLGRGQFRTRLDFDIANSIESENGHYCLQPRLSSYSDNSTGKIEGKVGPALAHPWVIAVNGTDTAYAMPEEDGGFQFRGLKPAVYSVTFMANAPYVDSTINNIQINAGSEMQLPAILLHQ